LDGSRSYTPFNPARGKEEVFFFSSGLYLRMYIFQALHLLLEFRMPKMSYEKITSLSKIALAFPD